MGMEQTEPIDNGPSKNSYGLFQDWFVVKNGSVQSDHLIDDE